MSWRILVLIVGLILSACASIGDISSYEDGCEKQGGHWLENPKFTIDVPVIKDNTIVTVKKVSTQSYCVLP